MTYGKKWYKREMPTSAFVILAANPLNVLNQISNTEIWSKLSGIQSGWLWGAIFGKLYKIFIPRILTNLLHMAEETCLLSRMIRTNEQN